MIVSISQRLQTTIRGAGLRMGIAQLVEAHECARDRGSDPWQFALGIAGLLATGMTESELRWLTSKGYVAHGCEVTAARDSRRTFQSRRNLAFSQQSCFVLTSAGVLYTANVLRRSAAPMSLLATSKGGDEAVGDVLQPQWDDAQRVLRIGPSEIKRYRVPAPTQEAVLAAFQEEGWPRHIDDPLSPQSGQDSKCRLHDTIKRLNRHHQQRLLRFFGDGTGEGVCWELVDSAALAVPVAADWTSSLRRAA